MTLEYGVNWLIKVRKLISGRLSGTSEQTFAGQLAKGSEITAILNENNCDAILISKGAVILLMSGSAQFSASRWVSTLMMVRKWRIDSG